MEAPRSLNPQQTLWIYKMGDYSLLSTAVIHALQHTRTQPEELPALILRLVMSTDLQHLGLHYQHPPLQQLAINLMGCKLNAQFCELLEQSSVLLQDIHP
jgi:hypothetical protein